MMLPDKRAAGIPKKGFPRDYFQLDWFDGAQKEATAGSSKLAMKRIMECRTVLAATLLEYDFQDRFEDIAHTLREGGPLADFQTPFPPADAPPPRSYRLKFFGLVLKSDYTPESALYGNFTPYSADDSEIGHLQVDVTTLWRDGASDTCSGIISRETSEFFDTDKPDWRTFLFGPDNPVDWSEIHSFRLELRLHEYSRHKYQPRISELEISAKDTSPYGQMCTLSKLDLMGSQLSFGTAESSTSIIMPVLPASSRKTGSPFYSDYDLECRQRSIEMCEHILANREYYCRAAAIQLCGSANFAYRDPALLTSRQKMQAAIESLFTPIA